MSVPASLSDQLGQVRSLGGSGGGGGGLSLLLYLFVCLPVVQRMYLFTCLFILIAYSLLSDQLGQVGLLGGGRGGGLFVTVTRGLAAFRILIGSHLPYCTGFDTMLNNLYPRFCNNAHCTRFVQ